jgi:hypothetical protein
MIWFVIAGALLMFCHLRFTERTPALSLVMVAMLAPLISQGLLSYFATEQSVGAALVIAVIVVIGEGYANSSSDVRSTAGTNDAA